MAMLSSSLVLGLIQLKNRIVMPPMATSKAEEGKITADLIQYYKEKSADEAIGLIIAEHSYVSMEGKASANQVSLAVDADMEGLKALANAIHAHHTPVFAQINHAGSAAKAEITGFPPLAPSAVKHPRAKEEEMPQAMNTEDLEKVISDFALAAGRAKEAGFDGVEIHSAHGYLLNQFYSPITNQRTDQYGGSLVNRIRLHIQIIERIRQTVGGDYPLTLRLGVYDGLENGSTMDEAVQACVMFEKAGLDFIDLSGGLNGYLRPGHSEQGYFQDFSEAVKQQVKMPVLLTGGITEAQAAEALLQAQKADLIGIGRAILKDSKWAEKALNTIK